jgi:hypothetical protein
VQEPAGGRRACVSQLETSRSRRKSSVLKKTSGFIPHPHNINPRHSSIFLQYNLPNDILVVIVSPTLSSPLHLPFPISHFPFPISHFPFPIFQLPTYIIRLQPCLATPPITTAAAGSLVPCRSPRPCRNYSGIKRWLREYRWTVTDTYGWIGCWGGED